MGAVEFRIKSRGRDAGEAYRSAVEDAIDQEGNDAYSGTIATCSDGPYDVTASYKQSKMSLDVYINKKLEMLEKRTCLCICIKPPRKNTNKVKSKLDNMPIKGKSEWVTVYKVETYGGDVIAEADNKTEAIKKAREYTERTMETTYIRITKVMKDRDNLVGTVKYKKSPTEALGEWVFFGMAAY